MAGPTSAAVAIGVGVVQTYKPIKRYYEDKEMLKSACRSRQWNRQEVFAFLTQQVYNRDRGLEILLDGSGYERIDGFEVYDWREFATDLGLMVFRRVGDGPNGGNAVSRVENNDDLGQEPYKPVRWPEYVVAIRGTIMSYHRDLGYDLKIALELMCKSTSIYEPLIDLLLELCRRALVPNDVCVVGHSLGAAMGLIATAALAELGIVLNAHLFNPPNFTGDVIAKKLLVGTVNGLSDIAGMIPWIGDRSLKPIIRDCGHSAVSKVGETVRGMGERLAPGTYDKAAERQNILRHQQYLPDLYVNPQDPLCSEYIEHFEQGSPGVSNIVPFTKVFGSCLDSCHLIPRARLHTNHHAKGPRHAHSLDQWWFYAPVKLTSKVVG